MRCALIVAITHSSPQPEELSHGYRDPFTERYMHHFCRGRHQIRTDHRERPFFHSLYGQQVG